MSWPGKWHAKTDDQCTITEDNGLLVMTGDGPGEYMWYDPNGEASFGHR